MKAASQKPVCLYFTTQPLYKSETVQLNGAFRRISIDSIIVKWQRAKKI